jgi:hypothetical protein
VTLARLTKDLERLLLTSGTLVACENSEERCRNTLLIDGVDRDALLGSVKGHQNHWVVACGDHVAALSHAAEQAGIEAARI